MLFTKCHVIFLNRASTYCSLCNLKCHIKFACNFGIRITHFARCFLTASKIIFGAILLNVLDHFKPSSWRILFSDDPEMPHGTNVIILGALKPLAVLGRAKHNYYFGPRGKVELLLCISLKTLRIFKKLFVLINDTNISFNCGLKCRVSLLWFSPVT